MTSGRSNRRRAPSIHAIDGGTSPSRQRPKASAILRESNRCTAEATRRLPRAPQWASPPGPRPRRVNTMGLLTWTQPTGPGRRSYVTTLDPVMRLAPVCVALRHQKGKETATSCPRSLRSASRQRFRTHTRWPGIKNGACRSARPHGTAEPRDGRTYRDPGRSGLGADGRLPEATPDPRRLPPPRYLAT